MHETKKTLIYVVVALGLLTTAVLATRPRSADPSAFDDQGQLFFPDFKDPLEAKALEVVDFDSASATPIPFKVMFKDNAWLIPSHGDYPADAKDRLARAAGGVLTLKKDTIRSDRPEDHKQLGVLDPLDKKTTSAEGVGKRVTLRDSSGNVLAELILGKEAPGRPGIRFVRKPDQNRTYGVSVNAEPSSRLTDWIETNLLKLDVGSIRKVLFDNTKIDMVRRAIERGEIFTIDRNSTSNAWTIDPPFSGDEELNTSKINDLTTALGDLKIVGVRRKPEGLSIELQKASEEGPVLSSQSLNSLARRGFHVLQNRLISNEGGIELTCNDGVIYYLRFGEVTFAQGEALSAGTGEESEGEEKKKEGSDDQKPTGAVESRYLFVTARFDPSLLQEPKKPEPSELPSDPFQRTPEERANKEKQTQEKYDRDKADYERKLADGKKRAEELTNRFAPWFYVVPGDAYRKIVLDRKALARNKQDAPPPTGMPNFPGGMNPRMPGMPQFGPGQ